MATVNSVTDEYVLRTSMEGDLGAQVDATADKLAGFQGKADQAAATAKVLGDAITDTTARFSTASPAFDRYAQRYDAVTKASNALAAAQRELTGAQDAYAKVTNAGATEQAAFEAVTARITQKITDLATKLGEVRAAAAANAEAQDAWNGKIGQGSASLGQYTAGVSAAAQAAASAKQAFADWTAQGSSTNAAFDKINANLALLAASNDRARASIDPLFAASKQYEAQINRITQGVAEGWIPNQTLANKLMADATAEFSRANQPMQQTAEQLRALATAAKEQAEAVEAAATAQAQYNQLLGVKSASSDDDMQKRAEQIDAYIQALDQLRATYDPLFAAEQQYSKSLSDISMLERAELLDLQAATAARKVATDALNAPALAAQAAALKQASAAQAEFNQLLGVKPQASADDMAKRATDLEAYSASLDQLRATYDPLFARQQQYEKALADISLLERSGAVDAQTAAAARQKATDALNGSDAPLKNMAANNNNAAFAARQAQVQFVQFVSSVQGGTPIFTAFIQQGHQLVDVAAATGTGFGAIKAAAASAWSTISTFVQQNPAVVAIGAIVAAGALLIVSAQNQVQKLHDLQDAIRGVSQNYVNLSAAALASAQQIASSQPISSADALAAVKAYASSPDFDRLNTSLADLVRVANDASKVLGITAPEAAKKFGAAIYDVSPLVQEFADKHLFGLDQAFADSIKLQVQSGDSLGAYQKVMAQVAQVVKDAAQPLSELGKAWEKLTESFTKNGASGTSIAADLKKAFSDFAASTITDLQNIVTIWNWARDKVSTAFSTPAAATAGGSGGGTGGNNGPVAGPGGVLQNGIPGSTARGLGQITQATATTLQVNPLDATSNVQGVFKYLQLLSTFQDPATGQLKFPTIGAQIGGYATGPNLDLSVPANKQAAMNYSSSIQGTSITALPADTAALIDQVGKQMSASDERIKAAKQIVMHESSGNQYYKGTGLQPPSGGPLAPGTGATTQPMQTVTVTGSNQAAQNQATINRAQQFVDQSGGSTGQTAQEAAAHVMLLTNALTALGDRTSQNATQYDAFQENLQKAQKALYDAVPATDAAARESDRQLGAQKALTAAYADGLPAVVQAEAHNKALADTYAEGLRPNMEGFNLEVEKRTQVHLAEDAQNAATATAQAADAQQRHTDALKAVNAAYAQGLPAAAQVTAERQAESELISRGLKPGMDGYAAALKDTTQQLLDQAQAQGTLDTTKAVTEINLQADAQRRVAAAYDVSYAASARATAQIQAESEARGRNLIPGTTAYTEAVTAQTAAILNLAEEQAKVATSDAVRQLSEQADTATRLAAAYALGPAAVAKVTAAEAARAQVLQEKLNPQSAVGLLAEQKLTEARLKAAAAAEQEVAAQDKFDLDHQVEMIQAETATLGMNSDARTLLLQHMKDEYELRAKFPTQYETLGRAELAERDRVNSMNLTLQNQQAALSYVSGQFSQAFDTIGTAMSQAFISGQGAAVNWGNVMKAVVQQVIQAFLKLAVLNPLLNSLFGQNNTTLSAVYGALSAGGSGTTSSASSGSNLVTEAGTVASGAGVANNIYTLGNNGTSILQSLGITGNNGYITQAGNLIKSGTDSVGLTGSNGIFGSVGSNNGGIVQSATDFLNTPISSTVASNAALTDATTSALNASAGYGPATASEVGSAAQGVGYATIGSAFSAFAAGYGAGSFAGSLVQGALNKTGPGPEIGAAAGSAAAVGITLALAPETGGLSLLALGLLGGTAGGVLGGFIGPHPSSPYSTIGVTVDPNTGLLNTGREDHQKEDDTGEIQALQSDIGTLNSFLTTTGIKVTNQGSAAGQFTTAGTIFQVGDNTPGGFQDPTKYSSLATAFPQLSFQTNSGDPVFNDYINKHAVDGTQSSTTGTGQFASYQDLTNYVNAFVQAKAKLVDFFSNILPPLTATSTVTGTLNDAVTSLNTAYLGAIATAKSLEGSVAASADDTAKLTQAEADLEAQRQAGIATANAAAAAQVHTNDVSLESRYLKAMATISGSAQDTVTASLYDFDQSVPQQRLDLTNSLVSIFGSAFVTTQYYADQMAELDKTLMAERAAIVVQGNSQITAAEQQAAAAAAQAQAQALAQAQQNASSLITSITSYVQKLQLGTDSALSPQAQYDLASSQFNAVSGAAAAGDYNSQTELTSYADALLQASRTVNGSGQQYATDTNRVLDALQNVADRSSDQLTADALAAIQQSQTDQVVTKLSDLQTVLQQVLAQLRSNGTRPTSLAA